MVGRGERGAGECEDDDDMSMPLRMLVHDGGSFLKKTATATTTTARTATTPTTSPTVPHTSPGAFNYHFLPDMSLAIATTTSLTTGVGIRGAANLGYSGFGGGGGGDPSSSSHFSSHPHPASSPTGEGGNRGTIKSVVHASRPQLYSLCRTVSNWNGIKNRDAAGGG
ncbi:hypothetical protein GYMLUDRAFT_417949 [Collybiopsis luxurians FD-317 M1]|uniref:Uncharacterized protein n=1 Tax=Collybiopsis luxurians FD-317 M1 TaxID=944289 RepID=A0A0D0B9G7_9AGAR|nr:hypothetical protein GYMLUDRAFT_417949 [Collybiopsis luxurians FD-317 M1]